MSTLYERFTELAAQAQHDGEYEAAYHALMAALHVADGEGDRDAVDRVGDLALRYGEALEEIRPPHMLSRIRAQERRQTAVFDSLRIHVEAVRARLRHPEAAR